MDTQKINYSQTVFLPNTSFSMKANLKEKEPQILKFWEDISLYEKILEYRKNSTLYMLHDGPPYANGHIHIGHALNKILKDILIKSKTILGYKTPYVPGWDCHGLPIEQQLLKELKLGKKHIEDIVDFRNKAKEFAMKFINIQREDFKRLGIIGEWQNPYVTMSNDYEASVIEVFQELWQKKYIQRDKKTIYWCPTCETALADAEIEYKDKTSYSIFVKFKLNKVNETLKKYKDLYLVIWTTTPWTLPSNMASAVSEVEKYVVLETESGNLIVAEKLVDSFLEQTKLKGEKKETINGKDLISMEYEHCLNRYLPENLRFNRKVISTDFVEMSTGSGIVHIAPGHGEEDFFAGKKWGLDIFCPVDETGKYTKEAGEFEGLKIFEANEIVIEKLKNDNLLLMNSSIKHSYPHCWRCKNPIIFRATQQWFIKVDYENLREETIKKTEEVNWIPKTGKERITSMIKNRPDWCLSRQRYWGTPIIAFYCKNCKKEQTDFNVLSKLRERVEKEGSDFWFREEAKDLLGENYTCPYCGGKEFIKEKDILDVWLDSGVSWHSVVQKRFSKEAYPADMYLEGSDQHRGWFQTSLIPSMALNKKAPYKNVLTHGFVLDDKGKAMHKSLGNVVAPQEVINKYGADILRLWVAFSDYSDDIRISDKLLAVPIDSYRKIRNTFRYFLGNLSGFKVEDKIDLKNMMEIDIYMLYKISKLSLDVKKYYENFEFRDAIKAINDFCILDLSSFYLDSLKDRLYTMAYSSNERKSAQRSLYEILKSLLIITSPVLSFTCEEAWTTFKKEIDNTLSESVFLNDWPKTLIEFKEEEIIKWQKIMSLREKALKSMEELRKNGDIGSSLEAKIIIKTKDYDFINSNKNLLTQVFIVSECEVVKDDNLSKNEVLALHTEGQKCPRCWQWRKDIGKNKDYPDVCEKCAEALKELKNV